MFDPLNVGDKEVFGHKGAHLLERTGQKSSLSQCESVCVCVYLRFTGNVNVLLHCWRLIQKFVRLHMYEMCSWRMLSQNSC